MSFKKKLEGQSNWAVNDKVLLKSENRMRNQSKGGQGTRTSQIKEQEEEGWARLPESNPILGSVCLKVTEQTWTQ